MLAEFIQKILDAAEVRPCEVHGENYIFDKTGRGYTQIRPVIDRPDTKKVGSLDALCGLVLREGCNRLDAPIFVEVQSPTRVIVYGCPDGSCVRTTYYCAEYEGPVFRGGYTGYEETIIKLRSMFLPSEGRDYLLDLLSRMDMNSGATSEDNGVTQSVTVRQGIALKDSTVIKPIVKLRPYRSFAETEQVESEYLLRVDPNGKSAFSRRTAACGSWEPSGTSLCISAICLCHSFPRAFSMTISLSLRDPFLHGAWGA